eukprot:GHVP01032941.1.p1 GENE.GHVP01032941.1~~GHVP01032941.1.p1  ORF type:complete len:150 (-),score=20.36 GHVP01032941.1:62-511(-)
MPKDRDGRRFWEIQICNCENSNYVKQKPKMDTAGNLVFPNFDFLKSVCTAKDCHKFRISWKDGLENEQAKPLCKKLWLSFEVAPRLESYRNVPDFQTFENVFGADDDVNVRKSAEYHLKKLCTKCFEPEWLEIQKSCSDESSESLSEGL